MDIKKKMKTNWKKWLDGLSWQEHWPAAVDHCWVRKQVFSPQCDTLSGPECSKVWLPWSDCFSGGWLEDIHLWINTRWLSWPQFLFLLCCYCSFWMVLLAGWENCTTSTLPVCVFRAGWQMEVLTIILWVWSMSAWLCVDSTVTLVRRREWMFPPWWLPDVVPACRWRRHSRHNDWQDNCSVWMLFFSLLSDLYFTGIIESLLFDAVAPCSLFLLCCFLFLNMTHSGFFHRHFIGFISTISCHLARTSS